MREIDESRKEQITKEIVRDIRKTGPADNTMDERVERGLNNGLGGLVKEMTHGQYCSISTYSDATLTRQSPSRQVSHPALAHQPLGFSLLQSPLEPLHLPLNQMSRRLSGPAQARTNRQLLHPYPVEALPPRPGYPHHLIPMIHILHYRSQRDVHRLRDRHSLHRALNKRSSHRHRP